MKTARELIEAANSDTSACRQYQTLLKARATLSFEPMLKALEHEQKECPIYSKEDTDYCETCRVTKCQIPSALAIANGEEQP